jgi:hypothetical protein
MLGFWYVPCDAFKDAVLETAGNTKYFAVPFTASFIFFSPGAPLA